MNFIYEKAGSLAEALRLKAGYKENGAFIAGGTDLLVDMRNNLLAPEPKAVIDISDLDEINYIRQENGQIRIGAGVKIAEIQKSPVVQTNAAVLSQACREFANPLVKKRATLGGNLINASPAADMAPPLLVLGAKVTLKSVSVEREIPLEEFFLGVKKTSDKSNELLTEVRFNKAQGEKYEFLKLGQRNGTSISIACLALMFEVTDDTIKDPRVALGSVAPTALRACRTENALNGVEPLIGNIRRAGDILRHEINPITDIRGSAEYRREISALLLLLAFQNQGYALVS